MKRRALSNRSSRRIFRKGAKVLKKNTRSASLTMRGGIRL